ncbi:hypothetical protein JM949_05980 [Micromonospora sp. STR1s_6]|uniref:Uncharacterized protein n=1 Tax=Micromonospora tarensis TaxID=2806100 RepID=A0ABS1YCB6_9ACTN|nr:hypothetical protein [Micromonospora tarensis]MBM0275035.1 hypothetical protein [Micromonospora tarensis]
MPAGTPRANATVPPAKTTATTRPRSAGRNNSAAAGTTTAQNSAWVAAVTILAARSSVKVLVNAVTAVLRTKPTRSADSSHRRGTRRTSAVNGTEATITTAPYAVTSVPTRGGETARSAAIGSSSPIGSASAVV